MTRELIFKNRYGKKSYKIIDSKGGQHVRPVCHEKINNAQNFKELALFFSDLKWMWGLPVDKAVKEYLNEEKEKLWPF